MYIREITNLNTKQVLNNLHRFRFEYGNFKRSGTNEKDFETLTDEAIGNIREDREQTRQLLNDLIKYLSSDEHRHKEVGFTAAKYVETLQRSNEQLVKIASLKQKSQKRIQIFPQKKEMKSLISFKKVVKTNERH